MTLSKEEILSWIFVRLCLCRLSSCAIYAASQTSKLTNATNSISQMQSGNALYLFLPHAMFNIYKHPKRVENLVLRSSRLASLQLFQVPPANIQASLVLIHALSELRNLAFAHGTACAGRVGLHYIWVCWGSCSWSSCFG